MPIALDLHKCQKPEVDLRHYGRHLVKSTWRYNSVGDHPICIKFGIPVQNEMPITVNRSKSKPKVEFKCGGRLLLETGSSNISVVDWDIWSKFGTQIVLSFPKQETSHNQKPKVDLRRYGPHITAILENLHNVITPSVIVQFGKNLLPRCRITCWWR